MFLTVDLASKFSAAVLCDERGKVRWQGDSAGLSAFKWSEKLAELAHDASYAEDLHLLIEDVPYGISNQAMVKPVLRLQGILLHALGDTPSYFINPSTWQSEYPGVGRAPRGMTKTEGAKYRIAKAAEYAKALGYEAPDLVGQWQEQNPTLKPLVKYTAPLEKARTDYTDAFLMNDWLRRHENDYTTLSGVQAPNI